MLKQSADDSSLISILTPAYKAEDTIARAVKSVLLQTYPHWEMIIVSDDGVDYQAVLAKQHIIDPRIRFSSTGAVGSGPSRGRNVALEMAKGEFITTLDADDEYHPEYLETVLGGAKQYGAAMVWLTYKLKNDGNRILLECAIGDSEEQPNLLFLSDYIKVNGSSVTMFARKNLTRTYAENILWGEDFYFDLQFFETIDAIPIFSEKYYIYHDNAQSITNSNHSDEMFIANYKQIITEIEKNTSLQPEIKNTMLATYHHRLFQNYLYLNTKARGECADFFDFMAKYPEHF